MLGINIIIKATLHCNLSSYQAKAKSIRYCDHVKLLYSWASGAIGLWGSFSVQSGNGLEIVSDVRIVTEANQLSQPQRRLDTI